MSQTNTDLLYIDDDYFYPDWYYVYTALAGANISSEFSITAVNEQIVNTTAYLGSAATVVVDAQVIKGSVVALAATATVSCTISHIHGSDIVALSNTTVTALVGVIKQNGTRETISAVKATVADEQYVNHVTSTYGSNWNWGSRAGQVVSFWGKKSNTSDAEGYYISQAGPADTQFYIGWRSTTHIDMWVWAVSGAQVSYRWSNAQPNDTDWHHYAIVSRGKTTRGSPYYDNGFAFDLYIDGVYKGTRTAYSTTPDIWFMYGQTTRVGAFNAAVNGPTYWDGSPPGWRYSNLCLAQLYIGPLSAGPSDQSFNLSDYYDGNLVDLGSSGAVNGSNPWIYEIFDAGFSSDITKKHGSTTITSFDGFYCDTGIDYSTIKSRFTLTAEASAVQVQGANLVATASLSAQANADFEAAATINAQANITAVADNRTRTTTNNFDFTATVSAIGDLTSDATVAINSEFTVTAQGYRTQEIILSAFTNTTLTVAAEITASATVTITANTTITAQAEKTAASQCAFSLVASCSSQATRIQEVACAFTSQATIFCKTTGVEKFEAYLACAFTQTALADKSVGYSADLNASISVTATVNRTRPGTAAISASTSLTTQANKITDTGSSMSSEFTVAAQGYRTQEIVLSAFSDAQLQTNNQRVRYNNAAITAAFTTACQATRIIGAITADMQALFSLNAQTRRTRDYSCAISALNFVFADGKVLKSDAYWAIKVQPETRILQTPQESLIITVLAESRVNIVEAETLALKVRPETLVLDY